MLSSGSHYQDKTVDYEALSVGPQRPTLYQEAAQARLRGRLRRCLIGSQSADPIHLPASGQAWAPSAGCVFHIKATREVLRQPGQANLRMRYPKLFDAIQQPH